MSHKEEKLIYHLTSIENLQDILMKGLVCRNELNETFDDVADHDIIDKRNDKFQLGNYVPFHFFMSNPFDGAVFRDPENSGKEFVYICVKRDYAKSHNWKIIPKHPLNEDAIDIMDYETGFNEIKWEHIDAENRDYSNTEIKESCMAECIAEKKVDNSAIFVIKCPSTAVKKRVDKILIENGLSDIYTDKTPFTGIYYNGRKHD